MADPPTTDAATAEAAAKAERKRKRLEAWRLRQQQQAAEAEEIKKNGGFTTAKPIIDTSEKISGVVNGGKESSSSNKPKVKIGLGLSNIKGRKKKKKKVISRVGFGGDIKNDRNDNDEEEGGAGKSRAGLLDVNDIKQQIIPPPVVDNDNNNKRGIEEGESPPSKRRRKGRWDNKGSSDDQEVVNTNNSSNSATNDIQHTNSTDDKKVNDALDAFMMGLETGDGGDENVGGIDSTEDNMKMNVLDANKEKSQQQKSSRESFIDSSGSMVRMARTSIKKDNTASLSNNSLAADNHDATNAMSDVNKAAQTTAAAMYTSLDWESDVPATPMGNHMYDTEQDDDESDFGEDEEEENARRAFIEALKKTSAPSLDNDPASIVTNNEDDSEYETKTQVKSEKERREEKVKQLSIEANRLRKQTLHVAVDVGRIYNDNEGGVMEEAERNLSALTAAPDALEVLAEMNKKKELRAVDHDTIDYLHIRKNLYIVPQILAKLTNIEVSEKRAKLGVKVRGKGAPAPVSKFSEAGLSERIMSILQKKGITDPFPIQAQCIPCIMAGRDVIGIAKTGSGKTLAFVLPMLRHILDQPPLSPNETGPIGLILAPARELAYQIHVVCKGLAKPLGLKSTAVYGGAGVAEQIGDLKRGTHILCATPGRLIDILTMQSGKLISLQRVSMVCLDESDRAYDMGFAPQISAILSAVRPDRQMVMFSATFPKAVENLAKKALRAPLEIIVGGRSVASDSVDQYAEVVEEEDKFLRLLQILGEHADDESKVIVFVGRQEQADSLFEQLVRCGYSSLSIHGGMDQEDRDSNMSDFKRIDGPNVLVATSVAGRGLDVPSCGCVVNYSAPNHLEDYVHRVGRTGRASNRGVAYTFVNSSDEAKFAPNVVRAIVEAGQSKNLSNEIKELSESFKEKVAKGEERYASSGYHGKGYTYDSSELSDAQKLAQLEKRQAMIESGMLDPDEEDGNKQDVQDDDNDGSTRTDADDSSSPSKAIGKKDAMGMLSNVSASVLAIPGMREALMKKAGMSLPDEGPASTNGGSHFIEEMEINDYPQQARWKVTQKETTSRLQDEFQTAVTLKGQYTPSGKSPAEGERRLYLHLQAQTSQLLQNCIVEIKRLLNEETLKVGARSVGGGGGRYSVM